MRRVKYLIPVIFTGLLLAFAPLSGGGEHSVLPVKGKTGITSVSHDIRVEGTKAVTPDPNFGEFPLYFIANKGQVKEGAVFYAKTPGYTLWLTNGGLVFDSIRRQSPPSPDALLTRSQTQHPGKISRDVSRLVFPDSEKNVEMVPIKETGHKVNYFTGKDRTQWRGNIPTSLAVLYKNIYKNIDLKVYGIQKQVEYDWIVKPGGDPSDIKFQYKDVKGTRLDEAGNLSITTDFGELVHKRPVSYQEIGGQRIEVESKFKTIAPHRYGIEVGAYDKNHELVIDPVVMVSSTYLGGDGVDMVKDIAVDSSGYVYVTGVTTSTDFPTKNRYQGNMGDVEVFVTKIDARGGSGTKLLYSTYLGGSDYEYIFGIDADDSGNVYVTGYTLSADFPLLNQYQDYNAGYDSFVTKLDTTKSGVSSLKYSTCLGGSDYEYGIGIAVDNNGIAYATGETDSADFPVLDQYRGYSGNYDCYITKLDTTKSGASSFLYSTYLGGNDWELVSGIETDGSGNVYLAGYTISTDFPLKGQIQIYAGEYDCFITKLDTTVSGDACLKYSTYLGGNEFDRCSALDLDEKGYVYVTGWTQSVDFPVRNRYQNYAGLYDAFVVKVDPSVTGSESLLYATFLGGSLWEFCRDIAVDGSQCVYVVGDTNSEDFPLLHPYQNYEGNYDCFVFKLDTTKEGESALIYSTYLGGGDSEVGYGIEVDRGGSTYVTGVTYSTDFPVLDSLHLYQNLEDGFLTKLADPSQLKVTTAEVTSVKPTSAKGGGEVIFDVNLDVTQRGVCWGLDPDPTIVDNSYTVDGDGTGTFKSSITGLIPNNTYYVRAYAVSPVGTGYGDNVIFATVFNPKISGTVRDGNKPLEGVTITFSHDGHTETTGSDGKYSYTVAYGSSTTVTASKAGYTFSPDEYSYTDIKANKPHTDFSVAESISVTIVKPEDGDIVKDTVMVKAEVSTDWILAMVEFYIDGERVKRDYWRPFKYRWDTREYENGIHTIKAIGYSLSGLTHTHQITVTVDNSKEPPHIVLDRSRLNFGSVNDGSQTGSQTVGVGNSGGGVLDWSVSAADAWINIKQLRGAQSNRVSISVASSGLEPGSYKGAVEVISAKADNSPVTLDIYLDIKEKAQETPPLGSFDAPTDNATVSSVVPVSGWAIDDIEVAAVKIYRDAVGEDETGRIHLGDAIQVEGARPDVETQFGEYPKNHLAGWTYHLLTNCLPGSGNGTFVISATAVDSSGNETSLGSKTIICDNTNASNPFGAIETPGPGGTASGQEFYNYGWVLTPQPNTIPKDGSTIDIWVDGVKLDGHPVYNLYREDIATIFSGYNNSKGAVGYYILDTTLYANGVHTIAWTVTDDAGNTSGIGSRYFNVMNGDGSSASSSALSSALRYPLKSIPVSGSTITREMREWQRIEVELGPGDSDGVSGFLVVNGEARPLPAGSSLDTEQGVFRWQAGGGHIGIFRFVFIKKNNAGKLEKTKLKVTVHPGF